MPLQILVPIAIGDAQLVSSTVPENDHPAWSLIAEYAAGDRVIRPLLHKVFERLVPGTTTTPPESDPMNWIEVGATNRWAMFDGKVGSATAAEAPATASLSVTVRPAATVRAIALLDVNADTVSIAISTQAGQVLYSRVLPPAFAAAPCDNWFDYYFQPFEQRRLVVLTGLPPHPSADVTITLTGRSRVSIGAAMLGPVHQFGDTAYGAGFGVTDYSRITTDAFGVTSIAVRDIADRMTLPVQFPTAISAALKYRLKQLRATPVVVIGSELEMYQALVTYGLIKDWYVTLPGPALSTANIEIQGLV